MHEGRASCALSAFLKDDSYRLPLPPPLSLPVVLISLSVCTSSFLSWLSPSTASHSFPQVLLVSACTYRQPDRLSPLTLFSSSLSLPHSPLSFIFSYFLMIVVVVVVF